MAGDGDNVVLGGSGGDLITTGRHRDVVLGDNGQIDYLADGDSDPLTLDHAYSIDPTSGGSDTVHAGDGKDLVFGGTGDDEIHGGGGHDVLLGDHGLFDSLLPVTQNFLSIFIGDNYGAGNDTIHGDDGDDFILGQQGGDTLFGDAGDDDLTGGHNVIGGADGNDIMDGGSEADVMLGDNGMITRHVIDPDLCIWQRYAAPFDDVIRDVMLYDILDGDGDNELIGGQGNDSVTGGDGNDILIGEAGRIVRAYNPDGTPRVNSKGSWHRDVFLEDLGTVTGMIDISSNPLGDGSLGLAQQIIEADLVLTVGAFDADGNKVFNTTTGAWETSLILIDLVEASNDALSGGGGEDVIFGQRGDDDIDGGDGADLLFGDNATNTLPLLTDMPQIVQGLRLTGIADGADVPLTLDFGGSVIVPSVTLETTEFNFTDPRLTIVSDLVPEFHDIAENDALARNDGAVLVPYIVTVPDIVHHADVHDGNDTIRGGDGDDTIFGDSSTFVSPFQQGLKEIDDALQDVTDQLLSVQRGLFHLSLDFDLAEHTLSTIDGTSRPQIIVVARDVIDGGNGNDTLVGDQGLIMASGSVAFNTATFTASALEFHEFLRDLEHAVVDFDFAIQEAHRDVLVALVDEAIDNNPSKKKPKANEIIDPDHHDLFLRNDQITGGVGNDVVIGDDAAFLVPLVSGGTTRNEHRGDLAIDKDLLNLTEDQLKDQQKVRYEELKDHIDDHHDDVKKRLPKRSDIELIPYRFQFDATIGHDTIFGNEGNDTLIGDFGIIVSPGLLETLVEKSQLPHVRNDIDKLVRDVVVLLNDHAQDLSSRDGNYSHNELQKHHGGSDGGSDSPFRDGADVMDGGSDNDIMLGDNGTITPFIDDKAAYNASAFVVKTTGRLGHGSDGGSDGGSDEMHGGDGNDILFGQKGADALWGDADDDLLFGGKGDDDLDGGSGKNTVKSGDGSLTDLELKILFENPLLAMLGNDLTAAVDDLDPNGSFWIGYSDGGSDRGSDSSRNKDYSLLANPPQRFRSPASLDKIFGELLAGDEDEIFSLLDAATYDHLKAMQADAESDGEAKTIALLAILQLLEEGTLLDD